MQDPHKIILEDALAAEHLKVIFQYSTDAHLLLGKNGIIDCNTAAVQMLRAESREGFMRLTLARAPV